MTNIIKEAIAAGIVQLFAPNQTSSLFNLSQEKTLLEYRVQVGIYAKAVEEIMNKKVTSVMLYSFEKGDFIQL